MLTAVHVTALCALIFAGRSRAPDPVFVVLAGLISGSTPPLIGFARGQWSEVVPAQDLPRAYALTAMLGDLAQIAGAPAAGLLAALVNPAAGLGVAAVFTTLGMALLLSSTPHPAKAEAAEKADTDGAGKPSGSAFRFGGLRVLTIASIGAGLGLGAVDVAVPALANARADRWAAGLMLGALGVGGVVGSAISPMLAERLSPAVRYVTGLTVLLLSTLVCVSLPPEAAVGGALLVAGFAWGVTNVVIYELLDLVVPRTHSTEAWAWLSTSEALGAAGGAALAGVIAAHSLSLAFGIIPAAIAVGLVVGAAGCRTLVAVDPDQRPTAIAP